MDRCLPSTHHHLPPRSPCNTFPTKAHHPRTTTGPISERTSPRHSSRLSHEKTNPHPSRVEYHSTTLSTSRSSLFRGSRATLSRTAHLGSCYRPQTWSPQL